MLNKEKNTEENQDYDFTTPLGREFLEQNRHGDRLITKGLEVMFINYFKDNRYIGTNGSDAEAVMEAYHVCNYLVANKKQLFNPNTVA
ncbi:hypothetical protein [Flavobacterium praedii]|uniref:hypothetical protein n=1 Tax=Flavobacterium praedii TaxID=3002900 RepID=UPI002481CC9D|nr:hypothetical protein [Flavobacterium praedii]